MAWGDWFKPVQHMIASFLAGTNEAGAALPGRTAAGGFVVQQATSTGTETGTAASPTYVAPGTGIAFPVTDNGGALTVDGTIAATQSGAWTAAATQSGAWTVAATQSGVWSVTASGTVAATQSGTWATQLVDENGAGYGVKHINNKPRVSSMPYLYDIAEGNVPGHAGWSKIGFNGDIGTAEEDLWTAGGSYVFPASAIQMQVVSSSGNDDGDPAGTGVRTVTIYYLDASYVSKSTSVTLNGVSAVNTSVSDIFRVQGFRAATCGALGKAAGNILLQAVGGATTYSQIAQGHTRARNITYTVPASKALFITSTTFGVYGATKGIRFTTRATYDSEAAAVRDFFLPYFEVDMGNGAFYRPLEIPARFPATVSIKVSGIADAAGAVCSCALRGWLEDA